MSKALCIYHANCADGFGAAWAVRHALGNGVEFYPGVYGNAPPDVTSRHVIIVDFSYKLPVMLEIIEHAASVVVLDHHKTAAEDLQEIFSRGLAKGEFSDSQSGAVLAWKYFHPEGVPELLLHLQDRDLWQFKMEGTREIHACVTSYPYDFALWDDLVRYAESHPSWGNMVREGAAIERKHQKDVAELVRISQRTMIIGGHAVPIANLPLTMASDAGNLMAVGQKFAGCYFDTPYGRAFSLRSNAEGLDVSEIAKAYGGGGHRNAAGFRRSIGWEGDQP